MGTKLAMTIRLNSRGYDNLKHFFKSLFMLLQDLIQIIIYVIARPILFLKTVNRASQLPCYVIFPLVQKFVQIRFHFYPFAAKITCFEFSNCPNYCNYLNFLFKSFFGG